MYNGFGVQTPRGTGSSGYIIISKAVLKKPQIEEPKTVKTTRRFSKALEDHEKRRKVEAQCYALRKKLEKENKPEEEIEKLVTNLRNSLSEKTNSKAGTKSGKENFQKESKDIEKEKKSE